MEKQKQKNIKDGKNIVIFSTSQSVSYLLGKLFKKQ